MKKSLILVLVTALLLTSGLVVYAETVDLPEWFTDMIEWRKDGIDQAVIDGTMTEAEAEEWLLHLEDMQEYRMEEGFEGLEPGAGCRGGGAYEEGQSRGFDGGCGRGRSGSNSMMR